MVERLNDKSGVLDIKTIFAIIVLTGLVLLCSGERISAHSLGESFEAVAGAYLIDVGYDPASFEAGFTNRFEFELWDALAEADDYDTRAPALYDLVWVRVLRDKRVQLATGIAKPPYGPVTLLYTFSEPGEYVLSVSYRRGDDTIAEKEFPFFVSQGRSSSSVLTPSILWLCTGVVIGVLLSKVAKRYRIG
jgi:hypothetical protein